MKKHLIGLALAYCATTSVYADEITLRFLNCTDKVIYANWSGYKVNVDHEAAYEVIQGQIEVPVSNKFTDKTLHIYRSNPNGTFPDEHRFEFRFVQGWSGKVEFAFSQYLNTDKHYVNKINLTTPSGKIYLPKSTLEVSPDTSPTPVADIQIDCHG